jgi:hypothetical protein
MTRTQSCRLRFAIIARPKVTGSIYATVFVERCLLDAVERLARMRGFTIGALSIAVANSLAVHEYRGRLHAHHRDR